jgi:hypothetical protein
MVVVQQLMKRKYTNTTTNEQWRLVLKKTRNEVPEALLFRSSL